MAQNNKKKVIALAGFAMVGALVFAYEFRKEVDLKQWEIQKNNREISELLIDLSIFVEDDRKLPIETLIKKYEDNLSNTSALATLLQYKMNAVGKPNSLAQLTSRQFLELAKLRNIKGVQKFIDEHEYKVGKISEKLAKFRLSYWPATQKGAIRGGAVGLAVGLIILFGIPWLWYFFLARLRETSDAIRGKQ